ncbi:hypothetical protein Patl1_03112 [Pistacia atlantica]|uniref:Uncharacterized protein n=1 Tax=Pistacia atlantica TaxID=434234 RepID=A0ACC1C6U7_9ROSI|nr:hypothetical protein Patl1_03112 [Pistacia atlantica]
MTMSKTVVFVVLMVVLLAESSRAMELCNIDDEGLTACKPSVMKPEPVAPSEECCKAVQGANLTCLCSYRTSPWLPAFGIDPDLALQLPPKCNLTPPADCQYD